MINILLSIKYLGTFNKGRKNKTSILDSKFKKKTSLGVLEKPVKQEFTVFQSVCIPSVSQAIKNYLVFNIGELYSLRRLWYI